MKKLVNIFGVLGVLGDLSSPIISLVDDFATQEEQQIRACTCCRYKYMQESATPAKNNYCYMFDKFQINCSLWKDNQSKRSMNK